MTTMDFITELFSEVDEQLRALPKHPEAHLWPREVGTLGRLHALKGGGNRAFHRWLTRAYRPLFPRLPERTRLFRLFTTHQDWTQAFLAAPTVLGVIDTYGIELISYSQKTHAASRVVLQEPSEPFTTLNQALTLCVVADRRKEQHVALALMIPLVMKMPHVLRQRTAERRFPTQDEPR
jgi:hypothetical protein